MCDVCRMLQLHPFKHSLLFANMQKTNPNEDRSISLDLTENVIFAAFNYKVVYFFHTIPQPPIWHSHLNDATKKQCHAGLCKYLELTCLSSRWRLAPAFSTTPKTTVACRKAPTVDHRDCVVLVTILRGPNITEEIWVISPRCGSDWLLSDTSNQ